MAQPTPPKQPKQAKLPNLWLFPATPIDTHHHVSPKKQAIAEQHRIGLVVQGWKCVYAMTVGLN